MTTIIRYIVASVAVGVLLLATASAGAEKTRISIADSQWRLNGGVTYPGTLAEGLLMYLAEDRAQALLKSARKAIDGPVTVAFSCLDEEQIEPLFDLVHKAIQELR